MSPVRPAGGPVRVSTATTRLVAVARPTVAGSMPRSVSVRPVTGAAAAALRRVGFDLVLCGAASADGRLGVMAAMLGERLGVPSLSGARTLAVTGTTARVQRRTEDGWEELEADLPAVVSTVALPGAPRRLTVAGIRAAAAAPVTGLTLTDLGIDPATVGLATATSRVVAVETRTGPPAGRTGDTAELVAFLADRALV